MEKTQIHWKNKKLLQICLSIISQFKRNIFNVTPLGKKHNSTSINRCYIMVNNVNDAQHLETSESKKNNKVKMIQNTIKLINTYYVNVESFVTHNFFLFCRNQKNWNLQSNQKLTTKHAKKMCRTKTKVQFTLLTTIEHRPVRKYDFFPISDWSAYRDRRLFVRDVPQSYWATYQRRQVREVPRPRWGRSVLWFRWWGRRYHATGHLTGWDGTNGSFLDLASVERRDRTGIKKNQLMLSNYLDKAILGDFF